MSKATPAKSAPATENCSENQPRKAGPTSSTASAMSDKKLKRAPFVLFMAIASGMLLGTMVGVIWGCSVPVLVLCSGALLSAVSS